MALLEDRARGPDRQTGAAVLLGDERSEEARLGERGDELVRVALALVELAPVLAGEAGADLADGLADLGQVLAQLDGRAVGGTDIGLLLQAAGT